MIKLLPMALAEVVRDVPIEATEPNFGSEPIFPFSITQAAELVKMYWLNRRFLAGPTPIKKDAETARTEGVVEVQEKFLAMLKLERLTGRSKPSEFLIPMVKPVQKDSLEELIKEYFENRRTFARRGIADGDWSKDLSDAKLFGRVTTLNSLLDVLGQRNVVIGIDAWVEANTHQVDWAKNRSTGIGELQ